MIKKGFDKLIDGVCSGIAEYIGVDIIIIRLLYVLFILAFPISAILFYIMAAFIMPDWNEYN